MMHNDRGSLTLEMAFVAPLMVLLVVGSILLGITFINKAALLDSSFVGAKSVAYYGGDSQKVRQDIYDELDTRFLAGKDQVQVTISYTAADSSEYSLTQYANNMTVDNPLPALPGTKMTVDLLYAGYHLEMPFMAANIFDLHASSISRNTNQ